MGLKIRISCFYYYARVWSGWERVDKNDEKREVNDITTTDY